MKRNDILNLLADRYLHGADFKDPKYVALIKELMIEILDEKSTGKLTEMLKYKIGEFSDLTAELYLHLAEKYLRKIGTKKIDQDKIYNVI